MLGPITIWRCTVKMTTKVRKFQRGETVPIWAEIKTWAGVYDSPDQGVKITITDPDGQVKAGKISVVASALFTVGLTVIGGTSGATGVVVEKPDATTLYLQQVTGTWESGEAITDTLAVTSTTESALLAAPMAEDEAGKFVYYYRSVVSETAGWWRVRCVGQDGLVVDSAKFIAADGGFSLE